MGIGTSWARSERLRAVTTTSSTAPVAIAAPAAGVSCAFAALAASRLPTAAATLRVTAAFTTLRLRRVDNPLLIACSLFFFEPCAVQIQRARRLGNANYRRHSDAVVSSRSLVSITFEGGAAIARFRGWRGLDL